MSDELGPALDWRRAESYRPLLQADAAIWAWEFGRRGPMASEAPARARAQDLPGLCFVGAGPAGDDLPAVLWREDPSALLVDAMAAQAGEPGLFDLQGLSLPAIVVRTADGQQHVLICDGAKRLRLIVADGDVLAGAVRLRWRLPPHPVAAALEGLRSLLALSEVGRLPSPATRRSAKALRWLESLRAHDARRSGASQRDIAMLLFGDERVRKDWNGSSDYMRMRVLRLLRTADHLSRSYGGLLGLSAAPDYRAAPIAEIWRSVTWRRGVGATMRSGIFLALAWQCSTFPQILSALA